MFHELVYAGVQSETCKRRHAWFVSALQHTAVVTAADTKEREKIAAAEAQAKAGEQAREQAETLANAPPDAAGQTGEDADTVMNAPEDEAGAGCSHTPSKAGTSKRVSKTAEAALQKAGKSSPKKKATLKKRAQKRKHEGEWVRTPDLHC